MRTRLLANAAFVGCLFAAATTGQSFVNGDFEQHTFVGCAYNQINTAFNAGMVGAVAYGPGGSTSQLGEIDVMDGSCSTYGPVGPVGTTRLGLAGNNQTGGVDAMTLALSSPLVVGTTYTVSFWGHSVISSFTGGAARVGIGTSPVAGAAGTVVGASALLDGTTWRLEHVTFTATAADSFLSVAVVQQTYRTWAWVDGFEIHPVQAAWCATANGNHVNPELCTCITPPILGSAWVLDVAPSASTLITLAYLSLEPLAPVPLPYGEVLIQPPVAAAPGNQVHVIALPATPQLIGTPVFAQGVLVENGPLGLDLVLTNAMVGVIGF